MTKIREGYKDTEIGVVPDEWKVIGFFDLLSDFIDFRGRTPKKLGLDWSEDGIIALSALNVKMGKIDFNIEPKFGSMELYEKWMTRGELKKDDILFTMEAPLGNVALVPDNNKYILSQRVVALKTITSVDSKYLAYYMMGKDFQSFLNANATGSTAKGISQKNLINANVALPPLPQQQRIAEILSTTDAHIKMLDKTIEDYQLLKKGMMKKLLTEGIGHTEFKETEIGRIPMEWEVKELKSIADVKGGKRLPKGYILQDENTGFPYIRVADMHQGGIDTSEIKYVPVEAEPLIKNYKISKHDIFISVAGTLGVVGTVPEELHNANLTENADKICNLKCDKNYLKYYLQAPYIQNIINNERTVGAQPKLALTRIQKFLIGLPLLNEQQHIAEILVTIDAKIESFQYQKVNFIQLKNNLLEKLLTGKVRVNTL